MLMLLLMMVMLLCFDTVDIAGISMVTDTAIGLGFVHERDMASTNVQ